mmetsp:Transcript_1344/g.2111  ORF Transcript_1344/g.2111 Transcript_1344/m.2111 type:complete len:429 (-) Transcript_1344:56-1342(-)
MISSRVLSVFLTMASMVQGFTPVSTSFAQKTSFSMTSADDSDTNDRRAFITRTTGAALAGIFTGLATATKDAQAVVYLDPAMYGDQENRLSAVASLREAVRRAILQKPDLAPIFYSMAVLDALSYDAKSGDFGPDGRIVFAILESTDTSPYIKLMKEAATTIVESKKSLKKLTSITIADAVALGGTESIQAIGGPNLSIQVGRTDASKGSPFTKEVPLDLLSGTHSIPEVRAAFSRSGLTEREMTAILSALMTLELAEKDKDPKDWAKSTKGQFVERGKMGRMSAFKKLTDEDIEAELAKDGLDDEDDEPSMFADDSYIADTFGTKDQAFGKKAGDLNEKNFNKYLQELQKFAKKPDSQPYGWIGDLILDKQNPGPGIWLAKYAQSYLNYTKDLGIAFNSLTQLGGEFTGGKYENLLKNRPRKTLNDE